MIRAGIFQCEGGGLAPAQRIERLERILEGQQLGLLVCQELFISGYNVREELVELAGPCEGEYFDQIARLAQTSGSAIVYGYPELDNGVRYNSAACVDASGALVANHRKLMLPPGFEADYFQPGDVVTLFELLGVKCALLICYDIEFAESVRANAVAGAELLIVPTALYDQWEFVAHSLVPTRAFENGLWIMYANHAGEENGFRYLGASCIVAPDGRDAARAGSSESLITAEIDLEQIVTARSELTYLEDLSSLSYKLAK